MIIEVTDEIPVQDEFCWLTLGQLKQLLRIENVVNMDARTVLSCIPYVAEGQSGDFHTAVPNDTETVTVFDGQLSGFSKELFVSVFHSAGAQHTLTEIISWVTELKTGCDLSVTSLPLNQASGWLNDDYEIRHETNQYFSVVAVSVQAGNREIVSWTQPLLKHFGYGIVGFLTQKINGTLHFLVRASLEPGNIDLIELGPTIACSGAEQRLDQPHAPPLFSHFSQCLAPANTLLSCAI